MQRKRYQKTIAAGLLMATLSLTTAMAQETQIPDSGEVVPGAPFEVERDWGTFKLADRIAEKVKAGEPINYVFSYQASGIPLFSQQFQIGFARGCEMGKEIYPMTCSIIAPVQSDPNQQVSQIEGKFAAGEIDCISIQPVSSDALTSITNKLIDAGIPAFTVGVPSNGKEFTRFTQIPIKEGATAAQAVLDWIAEGDRDDIKVFAVSGGDPTQFWAQGRMKGFVETIKTAIPDAEFVTTHENALNTSYQPGKAYDVYRSFLLANPNVQVIQNVDIGAEHANRAIESLGRKGQTFSIGWNISFGQLDGIDQGLQIALLDQRWPDQAAFGGPACAQFLNNGEILPNTQSLKIVTAAESEEARAELSAMMEE